jgi:anti-sigma factor RsiW
MQCVESSRAHAYFDGEVDAVTAADVERHVAQCPQCSALLEELAQMRARMQRELEYGQAPPRLRLAIERMLDEESAAGTSAAAAARPRTVARRPTSPAWRTRAFWLGASGGLGAALAASVVLFVLSAIPTDPLLDDVITAHVRSLMPEHLTDVVSTDRHTVKPWFAGHVDVSPVVADFAAQGYRLVGGRADYFDHQRAAVVVYQHGATSSTCSRGSQEGKRSRSAPPAAAITSPSGEWATCSIAPCPTPAGRSCPRWCGCCATPVPATCIDGDAR